MDVGVLEVVGVSLKKVERDAGGGVLGLGAWCCSQYSLAKALRCLSVKCLLFFLGEEAALVLLGLKRAANSSWVARFLFGFAAEATWVSVVGGWLLGSVLLRRVYCVVVFAVVVRLQNVLRWGWYLFHCTLSWASFSSCAKLFTHVGTSCSILYRSPLANCTRSASLIKRSGLSGSCTSRRICPSHCHFRFLMAVTMSKT